MKDAPALHVPAESFTLPEPVRVSELLRGFAEPLLFIDLEGPADLDTMRTAVGLAMICWNLPVYEAVGSPLYAQGVRTLEKIHQQLPAAVSSCLRRLIHDRKTKYAEHAFLVTVEVVGDDVRSARLVAEARRPRRSVPS
jgi:hypothetical protein